MYFTSCQHEPEMQSVEIHFKPDVMHIITNNCNKTGCHGSGEAPSLENHSDIHNYVTDFKPMQSKLHEVITAHSNIGGLMPPKPNPTLSKHDIDIISIWILQGAKDN